jgi:hypothetical protein
VGDVVGNVFGSVHYFQGGAPLPAGRYRVTYMDGCMKYNPAYGWTVHALAKRADGSGGHEWRLVGETTEDPILILPGTRGGPWAGGVTYANFDDCVEANLPLPPVEFDFAGGRLGVWLDDQPYDDNVYGLDSRSPTWSLACVR